MSLSLNFIPLTPDWRVAGRLTSPSFEPATFDQKFSTTDICPCGKCPPCQLCGRKIVLGGQYDESFVVLMFPRVKCSPLAVGQRRQHSGLSNQPHQLWLRDSGVINNKIFEAKIGFKTFVFCQEQNNDFKSMIRKTWLHILRHRRRVKLFCTVLRVSPLDTYFML